MKKKTIAILTIVLALSVALSACSGAAFTPSGFPGLMADGPNVYLALGQSVYSIQLANGQLTWKQPEKADRAKSFYSTPVKAGDQLLVGSYGNKLFSIDPATGLDKWSFNAGDHFIGSPLATETAIYAPNADHNRYALDMNGQLLWKFTTQGPQWAAPVAGQNCNCIYITSMDHNIYAVKVENGEKIWEKDLGAAIVGTPAVGPDGTLYVGTFGSKMFAIKGDDGSILWQKDTKAWVWSGPAFDNDRIYFGDLNGDFYAVGADGTILWQKTTDGPITGTPLIMTDTVYVGTEAGTVFAFDRDGNSPWKATVGGKLDASLVNGGGVILAAPTGGDALVVALNTNGTEKWKYIPAK